MASVVSYQIEVVWIFLKKEFTSFLLQISSFYTAARLIPLFQKQGDFLYPKSRKDGLTVYENKV